MRFKSAWNNGRSRQALITTATLLIAAWLTSGCHSVEDSEPLGSDDPDTCVDGLCEVDSDPDLQVPTEERIPRSQLGDAVAGLEALDVLLVVDNSGSMAEEQQSLATSIYNLVMSVVNPVPGDGIGQAVNDVRVAVASSDLGLQYAGFPGPDGAVSGCGPVGDDGQLQPTRSGSMVELLPGVIECVPEGTQCPTGWACAQGYCSPEPGASRGFQCPASDGPIASSSGSGLGFDIALRAACMAQVGTSGCGVEQQLEASVKALSSTPELLRDDALLAVIVVSDEEDCSIASKDLFETEEFADKIEGLNMACNYPAQNEDFLHPTSRFHEQLTALKGNPDSVIFAAFAGVPTAFESSCKGLGTWLDGCLDQPAMQLKPMEFIEPISGHSYWHFRPSCERDDDPNDGQIETQARPGRRFVQVAQDFGANGYMSSICDPNWKISMQQVERMIAARLGVLAE